MPVLRATASMNAAPSAADSRRCSGTGAAWTPALAAQAQVATMTAGGCDGIGVTRSGWWRVMHA